MNLLITGAWSESKKYLDVFKLYGANVYFMQNENDKLPLDSNNVEAVICNNLFNFHDINSFGNLKYVQLLSAGLDRFPIEKAKGKKITIETASNIYSIPISEHIILGLLSIYRNYMFFKRNQIAKNWEKNREMIELYGKRVMIFGCGSVGLECAKKLQSFGCFVIGIDITNKNSTFFNEMVLMSNFKTTLLNNVDIVISALPLNKTTLHFFDNTFFNEMKNQSIFINISRGQVTKEKDLITALKGKLLGAVLDVFENEPLDKNSELWNMDNVFLTPHNSFIGDGNNQRLADLILSNFEKFYL